jgi:hypothetical protein
LLAVMRVNPGSSLADLSLLRCRLSLFQSSPNRSRWV